MAIKLNPKFKPLYTTEKRYILLTGGRGSQKSFTSSTFICQLTYEKDQKVLYTRYTMTSAEISIIPEFKEKIDLLEVSGAFYSTAKEITNIYTGNNILFRGIKTSSGDQTANLKSINGISCFVVDEAEEFTDEDSFDTIDLSIRTKNAQNRVIIIMNPSNKDHWIYKRFFLNSHKIVEIDGCPIEISTHPDVEHIHTTYLDNIDNLNESFLKSIEAMKTSSLKMYWHKGLGMWLDIAEGSLFQNLKTYKPDSMLKFESSFGYIDIADEGADYLCLVIGRNIGQLIYITDIIFSDQNTDVTHPLCAQALKKHNVSFCRVESNSMGAMFGRQLRKMVPECNILSASSTTHKHTRILNDSVAICEYFRFIDEQHRPQMYHDAVGQLRSYTKDGKAKHDDVADACSGLITFIRNTMSHLYA
jgi:PBSX family phage terminase large subunit